MLGAGAVTVTVPAGDGVRRAGVVRHRQLHLIRPSHRIRMRRHRHTRPRRPIPEIPGIRRDRTISIRRPRRIQRGRQSHRRRREDRHRWLIHRRRHGHGVGHRTGRPTVVGHRQLDRIASRRNVRMSRRLPGTRRPIAELPRIRRDRTVRIRRPRRIQRRRQPHRRRRKRRHRLLVHRRRRHRHRLIQRALGAAVVRDGQRHRVRSGHRIGVHSILAGTRGAVAVVPCVGHDRTIRIRRPRRIQRRRQTHRRRRKHRHRRLIHRRRSTDRSDGQVVPARGQGAAGDTRAEVQLEPDAARNLKPRGVVGGDPVPDSRLCRADLPHAHPNDGRCGAVGLNPDPELVAGREDQPGHGPAVQRGTAACGPDLDHPASGEGDVRAVVGRADHAGGDRVVHGAVGHPVQRQGGLQIDGRGGSVPRLWLSVQPGSSVNRPVPPPTENRLLPPLPVHPPPTSAVPHPLATVRPKPSAA